MSVDVRHSLTACDEQQWWWATVLLPQEAKPGAWLSPQLAQAWLSGDYEPYGYLI